MDVICRCPLTSLRPRDFVTSRRGCDCLCCLTPLTTLLHTCTNPRSHFCFTPLFPTLHSYSGILKWGTITLLFFSCCFFTPCITSLQSDIFSTLCGWTCERNCFVIVSGDNTHLTNGLWLNRNVTDCMKPLLASRGWCGFSRAVLFSRNSPWETENVNEKEKRTYASLMVHSSVVYTETRLYTCSSIQIHPVTVTLTGQSTGRLTANVSSTWRCSQSNRIQFSLNYRRRNLLNCKYSGCRSKIPIHFLDMWIFLGIDMLLLKPPAHCI